MKKKEITIKEIAQKANVGIATVSRVLNNHPNVKQSTREKVLAVMNEHQFRPNYAARSLVKGTYSETAIGVALSEISHQFFFEIIQEIYLNLKIYQYNLLIFDLGQDRQKVFQHIGQQNLAGMIIMGDSGMTQDEKSFLQIHQTPFIYLDNDDKNENYVSFDNTHGGKLAAQYLISKNCQKIALIGEYESLHQIERFQAFKQELFRNNIHHVYEESSPAFKKSDSVYDCTIKILEKEQVDGIFYFSDEMAYNGLRAKKDQQSSVHIIGYDDMCSSRYLNLSTIRQDSQLIAKMGVESLMKLVQSRYGSPKKRSQVSIKPVLIDRGS
jgi:LacI family transcriptional regulator